MGDAQQPSHRFVGALEGVRERPPEGDDGIELRIGVARGVADVEQLAPFDAALGIRAAKAGLVQPELDVGDVGDDDASADRSQLQREPTWP